VCGYAPRRGVLEALRQIIALPDALGNHACECGHPEMRRLSDGVSHCPGCGFEVLPTRSNCHAGAIDTSRAHRQGGGGGHPAAVPPPKMPNYGRCEGGSKDVWKFR
jgi:ribosomal protein L37AE/L43A